MISLTISVTETVTVDDLRKHLDAFQEQSGAGATVRIRGKKLIVEAAPLRAVTP